MKGASIGNAQSLKRRDRWRTPRKKERNPNPTPSPIFSQRSPRPLRFYFFSGVGFRLARIQRCTPPSCSQCASWSTDSCEGRVIYHEAHEDHEGRLRQSSSRTCHRGLLSALVRRCSMMPAGRHTETECELIQKPSRVLLTTRPRSSISTVIVRELEPRHVFRVS